MPSMIQFRLLSVVFCLLFLVSRNNAQNTTGPGYVGYDLDLTGDPESAVYDTISTPSGVNTTYPPPDVFLNASVHVGEIDILVANLSAKINLDAQVLSLLQFNAGVDLSVDRVRLNIENVTAKVLLEARLANLVTMVGDVLDSIDLNPIIAELGQDLGEIVNSTVGGLTDGGDSESSALSRRSFELEHNILYSVNDYSGNTHTNRILDQDGNLVDQFLDNNGEIHGQQVVGSYSSDMTFNGYNQPVVRDGEVVNELEYVYMPFLGLSVVGAVFIDAAGSVVGTQVLSESSAGGTSTIAND